MDENPTKKQLKAIKDEIKKEIKEEQQSDDGGIEMKSENVGSGGTKGTMKGVHNGNRISAKLGGKNRQRIMKNKRGRKFKVLKDKNDVQAQKMMTKRKKVAGATSSAATQEPPAAKQSTSSSDTIKEKKKELPVDALDSSVEASPPSKRVSKIRERKVSLKSRMSKYTKDGKQKDSENNKEAADGNNDVSDLSSPEGSANENEAYEECAVPKCSRPSGE